MTTNVRGRIAIAIPSCRHWFTIANDIAPDFNQRAEADSLPHRVRRVQGMRPG